MEEKTSVTEECNGIPVTELFNRDNELPVELPINNTDIHGWCKQEVQMELTDDAISGMEGEQPTI